MPNKNIIKAKEWTDIGEREYNFAKLNFDDVQNEFYAEMCLMFHQSVEKSLKGYLVFADIEPPKTHDNRMLCMLCGKYDKKFIVHIENCSKLNKYYINTRYPAHFEIMKKTDAREAMATAKIILDLTTGIIFKDYDR